MARVQIERAATPAPAPTSSSPPATTPTGTPPISTSIFLSLSDFPPLDLPLTTDVSQLLIPAIQSIVLSALNQSENIVATASNPTQSHDSTSSSPTVPIGILIGAVLAAVVLSTGTALFVCYFRVRRRRRVARLAQRMSTSAGNGLPSPRLRPRQAIEPFIFSKAEAMRENMSSAEFIAATQRRRTIAKGSHRNPTAAPASTPQQSMNLTPGQRGNETAGRRAVDAGPVANDAEDEDGVESTLPPEYRDVFAMSRSRTVSSRS